MCGLGGGFGLGGVPPVSELGQIVSRSGRVYQITPDDLLWLARSVRYEGGNRSATAWTYAQRLMLFDHPSLMRLVQAHSQPVNPIWRRDGEKCRPGGQYHGRDECAESRLAVRDTASTIGWDQLPSSITTLLQDWAQARVKNPAPKATDFANAPVSQSFMRRHPDARAILRDGNWYLSEGASSAPGSGSNGWPDDFVTIRFRGRVAGPSPFAGVPSWVPWVVASGAGVAILGGTALALSRR